MASRLSLTEVLEAVLDDDSDDFGLSEDESSEGEDKGISAYAGQHYMNPEEVASLGRVVAQESDHESDSADSIYLTDSEKEAEQFQGKYYYEATKISRDSLQNNKVRFFHGLW